MHQRSKIKILKFLVDIKNQSDQNKKFSMQDLCFVHSIGKQIPTIMYQNGLLDKEFGVWKLKHDGEINIKLAEKVGKMASDYTRSKKIEKHKALKEYKAEINIDIIDMKLNKIMAALNIK